MRGGGGRTGMHAWQQQQQQQAGGKWQQLQAVISSVNLVAFCINYISGIIIRTILAYQSTRCQILFAAANSARRICSLWHAAGR